MYSRNPLLFQLFSTHVPLFGLCMAWLKERDRIHLLSVMIVLCFLECQTNEIIQYVVLDLYVKYVFKIHTSYCMY